MERGERLPDDDEQAERYLWTVERLARAGYEQYEISNFARTGFQSRHNLKYWMGRPYLGLGAAAHGVNLLLRATVSPQANYFYTLGLEGNPVLEGLWALLPVPLAYELPLLLVLLAVCALVIPLSRLGPCGREK